MFNSPPDLDYDSAMNTLEEAKTVTNKLSPAQRADLLDWLARQSVELAPSIFSTPGVAGGVACAGRSRIPVWLLEAFRRDGLTEAQLLEAYLELTRADLENLWIYVATHREGIDRQIRENDESKELKCP
jgi:uncharacterized protein (DUF433 family)